MIRLLVSLVLVAGVSMRGAVRALELVANHLGLDWHVPHWTTVRWWLLRIGLAALSRPWLANGPVAWMIDFSIQIGTHKCLVIMAIRLSDLPPVGECLQLRHLHLVDLSVLESAKKEHVHERLERAAQRIGVPVAIIEDHGGDVAGGVGLFQENHPETREIYDIKHKAACLLKKVLTVDPRWADFLHHLGQAKLATLQTPLAHVAPPSQRSKARFMNLQGLVVWATKLLGWMDGTLEPKRPLQLARIREKFVWLNDFRDALRQWSAWLQAIDITVDAVRRQGLCRELPPVLTEQLAELSNAEPIRGQLIEFVTSQAMQLSDGERIPGSTEILESCFGRLKHLERTQANSGFTGLVLSIGGMLGPLTDETTAEALRTTPVRAVAEWVRQALGDTVQSLRRFFYVNAPDALQKPDTSTLY